MASGLKSAHGMTKVLSRADRTMPDLESAGDAANRPG
jgi:hypothetical protein